MYHVNYELDIPGGTTIVPPIAVAIVLLGVLVAMPKLPDKVASMVQWTPAVAAVLLLLVPLGYDAAWEKPPWLSPPGFPVRVMSYNLNQGFDVEGFLAIEELARVMED